MRSLLLGAVAVLLLSASCSDSDDGSSNASATETSATSSTDAAPTTGAAGAEESADPVTFQLTVDGVTGGGNIPTEYTCDGSNETPTVTIEGVPSTVEELALIVDDPDAPTDSPFVHWVVYGIGPNTSAVTDGDAALTYGETDADTDSWFGPCPPPGDGPHTYRWKLFGLSMAMGLEPSLDGRALETAIAEAVVTEALVIASYQRAE